MWINDPNPLDSSETSGVSLYIVRTEDGQVDNLNASVPKHLNRNHRYGVNTKIGLLGSCEGKK